jgi:hypothetical protein
MHYWGWTSRGSQRIENGQGRRVKRAVLPTTPDGLRAALGGYTERGLRVAVEAGNQTAWIVDVLRERSEGPRRASGQGQVQECRHATAAGVVRAGGPVAREEDGAGRVGSQAPDDCVPSLAGGDDHRSPAVTVSGANDGRSRTGQTD